MIIISSLKRLVKHFKTHSWHNIAVTEYGKRIRELRTEAGLSQKQLAEKLQMSQSAVAKWESGRTEPTAGALIRLARLFGVSSDYIIGLED